MTAAGWHPDPNDPNSLRYWDGTAWTDHRSPRPQPAPVTQTVYVQGQERVVRPARHAHGLLYWVTVGWLWSPLKWLGRMLMWLFVWPLGLWRSMTSSRDKQQSRQRRGH